ncbi:formin-like protein 2 isoform X2 [Dysidea avara]|uniref:formin-like protein 2 isoform X2 n=1 Tax=Dysidea avara TaxID=196820 RepID=UPI0033246500
MGNSQGLDGNSGKYTSSLNAKDESMPLRDEVEERFAKLMGSMNLPEDKKRSVLEYNIEKKWQMIKDMEKRRPQLPPMEYLSKFKPVMDEENLKKAKKKATDPTFVQNLQGLEISLRTNHISWVKEFLNKHNNGLQTLVYFLQFRFTIEKELTRKEEKNRNTKSLPRSSVSSLDSSLLLTKPPSSSQESDIHITVLCLKALMNNSHGFTAVMMDKDAVSCLVNSMFYGTLRTVITVMELLAAVCLVKGGHTKIMEAVDMFKLEHKESRRFERLVTLFKESKGNYADFKAACMAFINVIVHSAENLNFRVHLQHEFTMLGLDEHLEEIEDSSPTVLLAQIQAYKDNYFNVQLLLEESATKSEAVVKLEQLQSEIEEIQDKYHRSEYQSIKRIAELEKKLSELQKYVKNEGEPLPTWLQEDMERAGLSKTSSLSKQTSKDEKSGDSVKSSDSSKAENSKEEDSENPVYDVLAPAPPPPAPPLAPPPFAPAAPNAPPLPGVGFMRPLKKKIETKYKLPLLNWVALPPTKINGTIFSDLDDENVHKVVDFTEFEETFKLKSQGESLPKHTAMSVSSSSVKRKNVDGLLEPNRAQNIAIARRKFDFDPDLVSSAITKMDLDVLPLESVEIVSHLIPNDNEVKKIRTFLDDKKNPETLPDEDRFVFELYMVERLGPKLQVMEYMGNFYDDLNVLSQQVDAVIAASNSVLTAIKLKKVIEIILAVGNYMNSSKRGGIFGFRLQSLDILSELKSTDGRMTLLHYIASLIEKQFKDLSDFTDELFYLDKAASVSLELLKQDVKQMQKGFSVGASELVHNKANTRLKEFVLDAEPKVNKLEHDLETGQESFENVVKFYGENPRHTQPSTFFGIFHRFSKAYRQAISDIQTERKLQNLKQQKPAVEVAVLKEEDDETMQVLNQIHDGAIDEIITGMKSNAFRPGGYRKSKVFRKSFVYRDRDKDFTDSSKRETPPPDPYSASRPWLK